MAKGKKTQQVAADPNAPLRQAARQSIYGLMSAADQNVSQLAGSIEQGGAALRAAEVAGRRDIYAQAGRGIAAGQAASGAGGGSAYGGALQAGDQAGRSAASFSGLQGEKQAQFGLKGAQLIGEAQLAAAGQKAQGYSDLLKLGSEQDVVQRRIAEYNKPINDIIARGRKLWWGGEKQIAAEIEALAENESNPDVKAWLLRKAGSWRSGELDL